MQSFADGKIDVYPGPVELGAADNLEPAIVEFIADARKSLDIAVSPALQFGTPKRTPC
jgi:hypothetical protein